MTFELNALLAAFGGGLLGAALGALPAFIFTGFAVLAGVAMTAAGGDATLLDDVAFGPFLGPHVAFAGGVAAAAYARRRGLLENGRNITLGLMGLNQADVLLVGGAFGAFGYALNFVWLQLGWGAWTDAVAFTVVVSAMIVRLLFSRAGLLGVGPSGRWYRPDDSSNWLRYQERPVMLTLIGLGAGLPAAYAALALGAEEGGAVLGFGLSAASLLFIQFGTQIPVTHHITLPAAVAALTLESLLAGALFGVIGAFAGEGASRLFLIRGDTHIDPPAAGIAASIAVLRVFDALI